MSTLKIEPETELAIILCSTWGSTLLRGLHTMRTNGQQCDVELHSSDNTTFKAHSPVLYAASCTFQTLLKISPSVLKTELENDVLKAVLDFIYLGHIEVAANDVESILKAAERFDITDLVEACQRVRQERVILGELEALSSDGGAVGKRRGFHIKVKVESQDSKGEDEVEENREDDMETREWEEEVEETDTEEVKRPLTRSRRRSAAVGKCRGRPPKSSRTADPAAATPGQRTMGGGHACERCGKRFKFAEGLDKHAKSHRDTDSYSCYLCHTDCSDAGELAAHLSSHLVVGTLKCAICDIVVGKKSALQKHIIRVHGQKPFACIHCSRRFAQDIGRKSHQRNVHHPGGKGLEDCDDKVCNQEKDPRKKRKPPAFIYTCETCGKAFNRKDSYTKHMHRHNGTHQFYCDYCGKGFMERECFEAHINRHQGMESAFKCDICGLGVTTSKGLKKHVSTMHRKDKPYMCPTCGVTFVHRSSYAAHVLIHAGQKPHKCEQCSRSFRCSSHLKDHMRIHTGEKPYSCSFCSLKFSHNNSRKSHERQHHSEQGGESLATTISAKKRTMTVARERKRVEISDVGAEVELQTQQQDDNTVAAAAAVATQIMIQEVGLVHGNTGQEHILQAPSQQQQQQTGLVQWSSDQYTLPPPPPPDSRWPTLMRTVHPQDRVYTVEEAQGLVTGSGELNVASSTAPVTLSGSEEIVYSMWTPGSM